MRAHTAPHKRKRKTLAPRPIRSPTQCVPPLKTCYLNVQQARNRALIARRRGGHFPHCLRVENMYRYKKLATKVRGAGRASIFPKFGAVFLGGETIHRKWCIIIVHSKSFACCLSH